VVAGLAIKAISFMNASNVGFFAAIGLAFSGGIQVNWAGEVILALVVPAAIIFGYRGYHSNPDKAPLGVRQE
jgi:hypothetical protein